MKESAHLDEVWFVVSPQNPFKNNTELADEQHRLQMVKLATKNTVYLKPVDIEFSLSKPSYTHHTLKELVQIYPSFNFCVIIGEDNVAKFGEWKEAAWIQQHFPVLVYNRSNNDNVNMDSKPGFQYYTLPLLDISATHIRERIQKGLPITYFVTPDVEQYIQFHKLYR
jgi:nicotinate-nucleotide adenylyltransferase